MNRMQWSTWRETINATTKMIGTPFEPGTDPNRRFPTSIIVAAPRTWCEQFCLPHQPLATYHVSMLRWYSRWARTCEERAARGARVVVRGARRDKDFRSRASMVLSQVGPTPRWCCWVVGPPPSQLHGWGSHSLLFSLAPRGPVFAQSACGPRF